MTNSTNAVRPANRPSDVSFSTLGQTMSQSPEHELQMQMRQDTQASARRACAALKVTSSIVNALVVHPGADADDAALFLATTELMDRAARLTDAALALLQLNPETRNISGYKNLLRQQAADVVSAQWRMAHATGTTELTAEQVTSLYSRVLKAPFVEGDGQTVPYPEDVDDVTAKRVSLLAVTPEIFQAVNSFDYFSPDPEALVEKGVREVVRAADANLPRLVQAGASKDTVTMVCQSLIGKLGNLYASAYRAAARRDVARLRAMDEDERMQHIVAHRANGLPTDHIDSAFAKFAARMVQMVRDAVPELQRDASARVEERAVSVDEMNASRTHQPS